MKFRRPRVATFIAIYFLFTLLCAYASLKEKYNNIIPAELNNGGQTQHLQQDIQPTVKKQSFFHLIHKHIILTILNQFLTIHDILLLRQTCIEFVIILKPNDKTDMIMFCKDFRSKEMDEVPLMWFDLKYVLNQSYANAFDKMEMFNIQKNKYAFVTGGNEKIIISCYNIENLYPKILFDKIKKQLIENDKIFHDYQYKPEIWNKFGTAWAKITDEGKLMTGGTKNHGGFSDNIACLSSKKVKQILATWTAFSALLEDHSATAWGRECHGGKIPDKIQMQLQKVKILCSNERAFAALLDDSRVVTWGEKNSGGEIPAEIQIQLKNVKMIFSTIYAFAALTNDGNVIAWGDERYGGLISHEIQIQLENVKIIFSTISAFAALTNDGNVIAWGDERYGGLIPNEMQIQLENVKILFSTEKAFSALLDNGTVFVWGWLRERISIETQHKLKENVKMLFPKKDGFEALCNDGSMILLGEN